jgi:hypothetical protein
MEALLATVLLLLIMGAALLLLARGWPRSSRLGGYRARTQGRDAPTAADEEAGRANREDDDVHWHWR